MALFLSDLPHTLQHVISNLKIPPSFEVPTCCTVKFVSLSLGTEDKKSFAQRHMIDYLSPFFRWSNRHRNLAPDQDFVYETVAGDLQNPWYLCSVTLDLYAGLV